MFEWLRNLWVSFMTFIMSLFGMEYKSKSVHFEEGAKEGDDQPVAEPVEHKEE